MTKFFKRKSIFSRIFINTVCLIVIFGICVSLLTRFISHKLLYENNFNSSYSLLHQVNDNFNNLFNQLTSIINVSDSSLYFRDLLSKPINSQLELFETKMNLHNFLYNYKPIFEQFGIWMTVIGSNNVLYTTFDSNFTEDLNSLLKEEWLSTLATSTNQLSYTLNHQGLNSSTSHKNVIIYAKKLVNTYTMQYCGLLLLEINPTYLSQLYTNSYSEGEYVFVTNTNGVVISSNDSSIIGQPLPEFENVPISLSRTLSSLYNYVDYHEREFLPVKIPLDTFDGYLIKYVDKLLINEKVITICKYIYYLIWAFCIIATIISYFLFNHIVKPLNHLSEKMRNNRYNKHTFPKEKGIYNEIDTLTETYNNLLEEINIYTKNIIEESEARRLAEFNALQMQINPHFLYNTLSSIDALVHKGVDNSIISDSINQFIKLLRSTIGDKKEFITLDLELENLNNYIGLQNIRYENHIIWNVFCLDQSLLLQKIPKLLLQPLVENAIFHTLSNDTHIINITLYINNMNNCLRIEIIDNGCGMNEATLTAINSASTYIPISTAKTVNHFSGIGIENIRDRIKLLYGDSYGLKITSILGTGTSVCITLPLTKE